jgi:mRNA-degrading endonuclease RelE of RelBE toxin-antitoxin system
MEIRFTARARKDFAALSPRLKAQVRKQLALLAENLRHPSLQAKKYDEGQDVWQARVNRNYRIYFQIAGVLYQIIRIIPHPK